MSMNILMVAGLLILSARVVGAEEIAAVPPEAAACAPSYGPAPAETDNPREGETESDDMFVRWMRMRQNTDRYYFSTNRGGILLVVEKAYLSEDRMRTLICDLQKAVDVIPTLTQRASAIQGRMTVYIFQSQGLVSRSHLPGIQRDEDGLRLAFVKTNVEPLFHEMTHMLTAAPGRAREIDSQSLMEGVADWVQLNMAPGREFSMYPANADIQALAKKAVARNDADFLGTIGAPGIHIYDGMKEVRDDFYFASASFVGYLINRGGFAAFWKVYDARADDAAYIAQYGKTREKLVEEWKSKILGPRKTIEILNDPWKNLPEN